MYQEISMTNNNEELPFLPLFGGRHLQRDDNGRLLQQDDNSSSSTSNFNDASALRGTILVYGSTLLLVIVLYSWLRRRYPNVYAVRSWVEKVKSYLADDRFHFFQWMWGVYTVTDDEIMQECGLDACCFVRLIQMGYRLSVVGMFNLLWLLPVYLTAEDSPETKDISDRIVKTTISHVPSGSNRMFATVFAAYIMFGYTMYLILQEFDWYIEMRHKFLARTKPEHFAVFVRNVPSYYRDNASLEEFFRSCFSQDAVLEARLAIHVPNLAKLVAQREITLASLEHAQALYQKTGIRPMHKESIIASLTSPSANVDTIEYYQHLLDEQNQEVAEKIEYFEGIVSGRQQEQQQLKSLKMSSSQMTTSPTNTMPETPTSEHDEKVQIDDLPSSLVAFTNNGGAEDEMSSVGPSVDRSELASASNPNGAAMQTIPEEDKHFTFTKTIQNTVTSATAKAKASARTISSAAGKASHKMSTLIAGEDGEIHAAGFVVFNKLSTTNAALQMQHHSTPFTMEVMEAPDPKDINWSNISRTHKDLQIGKLTSLALTVCLCLLWTIPMSFFASLANAAAVRQDVEFLDDAFNKYPGLIPLTEQMAPLLVVVFNGMLPVILEMISNFEGPISLGVLEASKFIKLAAFSIIQTFFVSAISGSVIQAISDIINDWTKVIDLLANTLPAQGTYFMQILLVSTTMTAAMELLRVVPLVMHFIRSHVGPNLTEKERSKTFMGLRPLADPKEFEHADSGAQLVLYFMVLFVYSVISPITPLITAFCFAFMGAMFRAQFIYVYPKNPDSGGKLWADSIQILLTCMIIAQVTILGLLGLKKGAKQLPFFIPLLVITMLFNFYIKQKHFVVAAFLPTRECVKADTKRDGSDYSFVLGAYTQPEMAAKQPLRAGPWQPSKSMYPSEAMPRDEEEAAASALVSNSSPRVSDSCSSNASNIRESSRASKNLGASRIVFHSNQE